MERKTKMGLGLVFILGCLVTSIPIILSQATTQGHGVSEMRPGTFGAGNYIFPDNLIINDNVGIGTASPTQKLEIFEGSIHLKPTISGIYDPFILLGDSTVEGLKIWYDNDVGDVYFDELNDWGGGGTSAIHIRTEIESGSPIEAITIQNDGDIGLGTTSPSYKLDVAGSANAQQLCIAGVCQASWPTGGGSGTVTSISAGTGITLSPNPIITTGTVSLDTTYTDNRYVNENQANSITSAMIVDGTVSSSDINSAQVQRRVTGTCAAGRSIRAIDQTGTVVTCEIDDVGITSESDTLQTVTNRGSSTTNAITVPSVIVNSARAPIFYPLRYGGYYDSGDNRFDSTSSGTNEKYVALYFDPTLYGHTKARFWADMAGEGYYCGALLVSDGATADLYRGGTYVTSVSFTSSGCTNTGSDRFTCRYFSSEFTLTSGNAKYQVYFRNSDHDCGSPSGNQPVDISGTGIVLYG